MAFQGHRTWGKPRTLRALRQQPIVFGREGLVGAGRVFGRPARFTLAARRTRHDDRVRNEIQERDRNGVIDTTKQGVVGGEYVRRIDNKIKRSGSVGDKWNAEQHGFSAAKC